MRREGPPRLDKWKLAGGEKPPRRAVAVAEPEEVVVTVPAGQLAPGALVVNPDLDPIPLLWPFGITEFEYLYSQISGVRTDLESLSLGAGAQTTVQNLFTVNQIIQVLNAGLGEEVLKLDIENNAQGVSYPLVLRHRYQGGVGPIGLGVGIDLGVESGTNNASYSIASFEAQSIDNTAGSMDGEAGVNVAIDGVGTRILTIGKDQVRIVRDPTATGIYPLFGAGLGSFVGSATGTHVGLRGQAGYTGNFLDAQVAGVRRFSVGGSGRVAITGDPAQVQQLSQPLTSHLLHVSDPIPSSTPVEMSFSKHPDGGGMCGLHLSQASTDQQPIGISLDLDAVPLWGGFALDYDKTVGGSHLNTDLVLAYSHVLNGDVLRMSHRAAGSGGVKLIFGQIIGSPNAEPSAFTVGAASGVGGLELRVNSNVASHLTLTQQSGSHRTAINFHNKWQLGTDFAAAGSGGGGSAFYVRDLVANAHRIFMDASGNLALGGSNNPRGLLNIFAAPTASGEFGLLSLGGGGFTGGAGHFSGDAQGTVVAGNVASGYTGNLIDLQVNGVSKFRVDEAGAISINGSPLSGGGDALIGSSNAWSASQTFTLDDTNSSGPSYPVRVRHTHSAGAGTTGIAAGIQFEMETATAGTNATFGNLYVDAINAGVGNLTSVMRINLKNNNADIEAFRIGNNYAGVFHAVPQATDRGLFYVGPATFLGHASGTLLGAAEDNGYAGDMLNLQVGTRPRTQVSGVGTMTQTVHDGATTAPTAALQIQHRIDTAGTPAVGMGVGLEFRADDAGKTVRVFGKIEADGRTLTAGAVDADLVLYNSRAGTQTEALRCRASDGNVRVIEKLFAQGGLGAGNAVSVTTLAAPGTVVRRLEIFDAFTGASLGSVPLYNNASFS